MYDWIASSYFFDDICALPADLSLSAAALSAAEGALGAEVEAEVEALAVDGEASLSLVFRKTSKMERRLAGLTERRSTWVWLEGSTPNASPIHWTT